MTSSEWIIGVDGGGTKCKAALYNATGDKLIEAIAGSANIFTDFEGAIDSIERSANQVIKAFNQTHNQHLTLSDCVLSAGCAGASIQSAYDRFVNWRHPFKQHYLSTDIHFSCLAANLNHPCTLVLVGTGSCIAIYSKQRDLKYDGRADDSVHNAIKQFGGHGFVLGDIASGAWLGKQAVSWYLQALETPTSDTDLFDALQTSLGTSVSHIIEEYGRANASAFGQLVPVLINTQKDSSHIQAWLKTGVDYLANIVRHHSKPDQGIFIDGGLSALYKPMLGESLGVKISQPKQEATYGAYLFAKERLV